MLHEWILMAIFFGVSLVGCCIGFKKFVWFLSIGYGFSVAALGIAYFVMGCCYQTIDVIGVFQCLLFVLYGARLSGFLLARELKNASYRKVLASATKEGEKKMPIFVLATIWIMVGVLYVGQTAPVMYRMINNINAVKDFQDAAKVFAFAEGYKPVITSKLLDSSLNECSAWKWAPASMILPLVGVVLSFVGLGLETLADFQKTNQKKTSPNMVATKGLYKAIRCPNYFGEILFWTGVFIGGVTIYNSWWQWVIAALSWVCIVYIMINGAQRLDKRQEKNYGTSEEYRAYADHTPLIFPLIPVSHIGIYKVEDVKAAEEKKAAKKAAKQAKKESK